ncbi:MAG: HlyD family efflux transporter periplasmic adaptor subunit [Butyricicoccus sp.]
MRKKKQNGIHRVLRFMKTIWAQKALRLPVAVFAIIILYIAGSWAVTHYHPIETVPAISVTMDDAVPVTGYFIREEQVVDVGSVSTAEYNFSDGDKVALGSSLVTVYRDEQSLEDSQELEEVRSSISQLEALQNNSYVTNTSQIDQKISSVLYEIGDAVDSADFDQLPEQMSQLREYALKSGSMNGDISDLSGQLSKLYKQEKKLEQSLNGKTTDIVSEFSGYFSQTTDGYENIFTYDCVDSLTVSGLKELASKRPAQSDAEHCKLISAYNWYYAVVLSAEDAARFTEGQSVTLRFAQPSDHVAAKVYAVRPDEDSGETLVLFQSNVMNSDLVTMRKEIGTVVLATYSGLKVPIEAIHVKNDQVGVYILNNTVSSFKTITPLYKGTEYYIVEQDVIGDDSLVVNDDIIVYAKDIDDKKVVK